MSNDLWANAQISALLAVGVNPIDAQQCVAWVQRRASVGVDPKTWVPSADDVSMPLDDAILHDARVAWYVEKPSKVKRMLDARVSDD